jgi:Ser/Thr protein kinase RdoA (MazF antagonist)
MLGKTPKGLVHGDFFFENVLSSHGMLAGVIDFGDVYYGSLVMDIAIGSMEFAMKEGEVWDFDLHEQFLAANKGWLVAHNISFDLFHDVLLANCARFIAHLCHLRQDELEKNNCPEGEIDLADIPYVARFYMFQQADIKTELHHHYRKVVGR